MPYKLKCESCQAIGEIDEPVETFSCPCCNGTMRPLKEVSSHELDNVPTMVISRDDLKALREAKAAAAVGQRPIFGKKTDTASKTFSRPMPQQNEVTRTTPPPTATGVSFAKKTIAPRPVQPIRSAPPPASTEETPTVITTIAAVNAQKTVVTPVAPVVETAVTTPEADLVTPTVVVPVLVAETIENEKFGAPVIETKVDEVKTPAPVVIEETIQEAPVVETAVATPEADLVTPTVAVPVLVAETIENEKFDAPVIETKVDEVKTPAPVVIEETIQEAPVVETAMTTTEADLVTPTAPAVIPEVTPIIVAKKEEKESLPNEDAENKTVAIKPAVLPVKKEEESIEGKVSETKSEEKTEEKKTDSETSEDDKKSAVKKKSIFGKDPKPPAPLGAFAKKGVAKKTNVNADGEKALTTNEKGQLLKRLKTNKFEIIKDAKGVAVYAPDGVLLNEIDTEKYLKVFAQKRKKVAIMLSIVTLIAVIAICGIIALIIKGF